MKNWWVKFGCFLIGYNYSIVSASSEITAKAVKRYTSALVIVCLLWAFIGYSFTQRYLDGGILASAIGAIVMCVVIIQIERQIILDIHKNWILYIFRFLIALMMAFIGSIIIDQVLFEEDIAKKKVSLIDDEVNKVYPKRSAELQKQILKLDTLLLQKEFERSIIIKDISLNPTLKIVNKVVNAQTVANPIATIPTDSTSKNVTTQTRSIKTTSSSTSSIQNPKFSMIGPLDKQIDGMRNEKMKKDSSLLVIRTTVENELKSKNGFLDELNVMYVILSGSGVALTVWLVWLIFLFGLEMFILASKAGEKSNDYDATLHHQMNIQLKKLELLAKNAKE